MLHSTQNVVYRYGSASSLLLAALCTYLPHSPPAGHPFQEWLLVQALTLHVFKCHFVLTSYLRPICHGSPSKERRPPDDISPSSLRLTKPLNHNYVVKRRVSPGPCLYVTATRSREIDRWLKRELNRKA